jgi:thiol:disulfide interchange protein
MNKNKGLIRSSVLAILILLALSTTAAVAQKRRTAKSPATPYTPITEYDPKRDAAQDLAAAIREAQRSQKHILVEVGGQWCSWCHTLDRFFVANPELVALRDRNFVTVKINFSEENENAAVLSRYPQISGFPHMFFLDSKGKLLLSQDTGVLESDRTYNLERLTTVLINWGPNGAQ